MNDEGGKNRKGWVEGGNLNKQGKAQLKHSAHTRLKHIQ